MRSRKRLPALAVIVLLLVGGA
ncbi:MAG: hypothetical protein QOJ69_641, partial [Actinomycetota bacterium]|nr:hypothetical protein [Actinomycetota bacterium]